MPVHRRRFRIEEAFVGDMPMPAADGRRRRSDASRDHDRTSLHPRPDGRAGPRRGDGDAARRCRAADRRAQALLETYRAQIEQCEKLKVELDLIYDAINRTKREIAVLHGKSFDGDEMSKVTGELGAVVGGTEEATQQILEAAEAIDQAASALAKVNSPDQQKILSEEIQERVVSIFEACNFQDLTGQRISKVMTTMKFIENHITVMMDIWGGVDAIKAHAPADHRRSRRRRQAAERTEAGRRRRPCLAERHRRPVRLRRFPGAHQQNAGPEAGVFRSAINSRRHGAAGAAAIVRPIRRAARSGRRPCCRSGPRHPCRRNG